MNPELKALLDKYAARGASEDEIRQVAAAWKAQHEAAPAPAAPALAAPITASDLINSAYQGLTMNWGDELAGVLGGGDAARDAIRAHDAQFHNDHPYVDDATKLVAGAVPFLAGGAEAKGAGLLYNLLRGGAIGAATGAVSGAGEGTDAASRTKGAVTGGLVGGTLGAAIPGGVALAKQAARPGSVALQELVAAANKSGGVQALRKSLADIVSANRGDVATLADLSPQLASKADFAANNSEDSFNAFVKKLGARQKDASDRLQQDAVGLLGQEPNADATLGALTTTRQNWANQAYSALPLDEEVPAGTVKDALGAAFDKPAVKNAIKQARLAGDLDPNSPAGAALIQLAPGSTLQQGLLNGTLVRGGPMGVTLPSLAKAGERTLTWDDLHQLKQVFQDRANDAFTKGGSKGALGRAYSTLADAIENQLNEHVDGYDAVTQQYRQLKNLERAVSAGGEMWNQVNSRGLASAFSKLSPQEQEAYRVGLASQMIDKLQNVQTNRNEASAYVNAGQNLQRKLQIIFGDDNTFQEFMRRAEIENKFNGLKSVVGNSATYRRAAAGGVDPLGLALEATRASLRGGHLYGAVTGIQRAAQGINSRRIADALGPMLLTEGAGNISRVLDRIGSYNPALGQLTGTVAPAVSGRVPGLFGLGQQ